MADIRAVSASNSVTDIASLRIIEVNYHDICKKLFQLQGTTAEYVTLALEDAYIFILKARGKGGHAAFPDGTLNATQVLLSTLIELELLEEREFGLARTLVQFFSSPYAEMTSLALEDEKSGKLTLNPRIWYSQHPGKLSIDCDIRNPVSWCGEQIIEILQQQLMPTNMRLKAGWRDVPPFYLSGSDPVISLLQKVWNDTTGYDDKPYAMGGVTHSIKLPNAITFGPSYRKTSENIPRFLPEGHGQPHGADETIHLPSLLEAIPKYVIAIIRLDKYLLAQPRF